MTSRILVFLAGGLLVAGCAGFPELDGKPTGAMRAAEFRTSSSSASATPVWALDFGDSGLRQMLAQADSGGLDAAAARARFKAADLALDQAQSANGLSHSASGSADRKGATLTAGLTFEPDLAGRFDAALAAARLEHAAGGLELIIARRTLAREVVLGWVALGDARTSQSRIANDIRTEEQTLSLLRLRRDAGEITATDLVAREQALNRLKVEAANAPARIALAEARLRALGVSSIPGNISLKSAARPAVPGKVDLSATARSPSVCTAWLRFRAADATRAETLAAARPRVVLTSSLSATAKTLAGLISGNAAAITNNVRVEGDLLDNGQSRRRLDQARLSVAQAEIEWLRARNQAEIAVLEAMIARHGAEAGLSAALDSWQAAKQEQARAIARQAAGVSDGLDLAEAERAIATAQREVDTTRAETFRAAASLHEALPQLVFIGQCGATI